MAKKGDKRTEKDLREEYFDGPASDTMSFEDLVFLTPNLLDLYLFALRIVEVNSESCAGLAYVN